MKEELYQALDSLASAYAEPDIKEDGLPRFSISGKKGKSYGMVKNAIDKLGEIEDAEEELGTDFLILSKAKKHGIYRKMADGIEFYPRYVLSVYIDYIMVNTSGKQLYLFEYGKTWALKKEELE